VLNEIKLKLPHIELAALSNVKHIDPSKPTLLMLHGYLDNASSFETLLVHLNSYQCIAVDMAGHGKSQHRNSDAHYHLIDYAYDLHQLVNTLSLKEFVLIGHSLGAIVSSIYAATQPHNIKGFIAIESCGPLVEDAQTTAQQLRNCFESREKANKEIRHPKSIEAVIRSRCAVSDLSSQHAQQIMSRNVCTNTHGQLQWRTDKRLRTTSPIRMTEEQACAVLNSIVCKRALILGSKGFEKVKVAIKQRQVCFAGVPTATFKGGHHVHLDSEDEVATYINSLLDVFFVVN
jgi:pimeloyl-ACP methyl ester carboxylesterase